MISSMLTSAKPSPVEQPAGALDDALTGFLLVLGGVGHSSVLLSATSIGRLQKMFLNIFWMAFL